MTDIISFLFIGNSLTLVLKGASYPVPSHHPNFDQIKELLGTPEDETKEEEEARCDQLISLIEDTHEKKFQEAVSHLSVEDVVIKHGRVYVRGQDVNSTLSQRIIAIHNAGLPYEGYIQFLVNLDQNPSADSRSSLFDFLERGRFPITSDGCFLGYKSITSDMKDHHTGKFDNTPGAVHSMPRENVDANRGVSCGSGFHIGTLRYAQSFGRGNSVIVLCKVNPRDAVAVPTNETDKLRVCKYEVVRVYFAKNDIHTPVLVGDEVMEEDFDSRNDVKYKEEEQQLASRTRQELEDMGRDDVCRLAAASGYFVSTNEARWAGKDIVVETMINKGIPFHTLDKKWLAKLALRRKLVVSQKKALRMKKDDLVSVILAGG